MHPRTAILSAAVGALVTFGMVSLSAQAADEATTEKCYGVAKAGKNDCAAQGHACAGQAKTTADGKEFIKLPAGTCQRLVGGSTTPKA